MAALHRMLQNRAEYDGAVVWDYIRHFQSFPALYLQNLLSVLPSLKSIYGRRDLPRQLMPALFTSKAGKVFISGCPGSGKSRLLLDLARAALGGRFIVPQTPRRLLMPRFPSTPLLWMS